MTTYQETNAVTGSTQEEMKLRYTAKTHTSGGRRGGVSPGDDGRLDVKFSAPGAPGTGTSPEQLFASGWSACFISAMGARWRPYGATVAPHGKRTRPGSNSKRRTTSQAT